jgi:hypothetical protein
MVNSIKIYTSMGKIWENIDWITIDKSHGLLIGPKKLYFISYNVYFNLNVVDNYIIRHPMVWQMLWSDWRIGLRSFSWLFPMTINAIGISFCYTSNVTMMDKNYCKINITPRNEISPPPQQPGGAIPCFDSC